MTLLSSHPSTPLHEIVPLSAANGAYPFLWDRDEVVREREPAVRITLNGIVEGAHRGVGVDLSPEYTQSMLSKQVVKLRWERTEPYLHWQYPGKISWQCSPKRITTSIWV
jgi:hypothetical protein